MSHSNGPLCYHSYLLRFWAVRGKVELPAVWRFSLTDPHTGERQGFADLEALVAFLQDQTRGKPLPEKEGGDEPE
ncbi:MAG: hypothetical protein JXA93_25225 [Anaerolineae bacterium]|nr:hypothetical protein [Anaerolineae bacterium]